MLCNTDFIQAQLTKINNWTDQVDTLTEEKYTLQANYRKLEAEVGPIKYIAEFVYGESADKDLLEEAVRWVIILIIFVFDPLAVLLLIASQYTFHYTRPKKPEPDPQPDPQPVPMFEDVDQETLDNEFKDEEVADLPEQKEVNTVEENNMTDKDQIDLFKNIGVTKIKGKLGFPKNEHNKEQIKKALKSQGVDIKFLDDEE